MRKLLALTCAVLLALVAAGCGSGGGFDDAGATTVPEATTTTAAGGSEAEYVAALETNLTSGKRENLELVIADGEAACVAPAWLDAIGLETFLSGKANPDEVANPGFVFADLGLDPATAQKMIDAFEPCGVDIYAELATSFTQGLDEAQQSCSAEKVDPAVANALLLTAYSNDAGSGEAEVDALVAQLTEACDLPEA